MSTVIQVEGLSKLYRLGTTGTGTISHDINRWFARIRGKEDPYSKIGTENNRASASDNPWVWSLRDIAFEVNQGDAVGIIGRNGAGKSTLLKVLSRVTSPTSGSIKIAGRVASLLEVGTGFHPELTGRENIFLNGAILGMRKAEIRTKLDEIVDFAGVQRYIDTPVKRYSSGMYVRLAFAVAAHLEPEILIVDEVLAVGDAEFQKKCLGKMQDVSQNSGRTVLFVSHNMAAVKSLCNKGIILSHGKMDFMGSSSECVNRYLNSGQENDSHFLADNPGKAFQEISLLNKNGEARKNFAFDEPVVMRIRMGEAVKGIQTQGFVMSFRVKDQLERNIFTDQTSMNDTFKVHYNAEGAIAEYTIPGGILVPNTYSIHFALHIPHQFLLEAIDEAVSFEIEETGSDFFQYKGADYGCVVIKGSWK
jgi:lipopolysaccharide transport system ATP-binding protein